MPTPKRRELSRTAWKNAVSKFLRRKPRPGLIITWEWLIKEFDLEDAPTRSRQQWVEYTWALSHNISNFINTLLVEHSIDIHKIEGGFEVTNPPDQTEMAIEHGSRRIAHAMNKMRKRIFYIDHSKLDPDQMAENADALRRTAILCTAFENQLSISGQIKSILNKHLEGSVEDSD